MNFKENFKNLIEKLKGLEKGQVKSGINIMIGFIIMDLLGFYWFLGLKTMAKALLIVALIIMGVFLYLDSRFPEEKGKKEEKPKDDDFGSVEFLPDAENYQKRLEKAMGSLNTNI